MIVNVLMFQIAVTVPLPAPQVYVEFFVISAVEFNVPLPVSFHPPKVYPVFFGAVIVTVEPYVIVIDVDFVIVCTGAGVLL